MPAVSKQQQRLFGLALSVKRGDTPRSEVSDDVRNIVDTMSEKEIEKYAGTGHTGLPTKKEEVEELIRQEVRNYVRPVIGEGRAFINAARKAKEEGKTEFEFNGKTYPVTIKEGVLNEMTDLEYVGDQLVNGVGEGFMSRNEFVKLVGKETKYDKNTLGKIYDAYLKLDGRNRVKLDMTRNMNTFLKKMGLKEGLDENFTKDDLKESVVNEAQKVPPQFISFLKMDYKNVKDTPRERKKLSKKLRKMPKDVLKQLADEDIGVLSSTSKELLGMSVAESVVNEAKSDLDYVVDIIRDAYGIMPINKFTHHVANRTKYTIDELEKVYRAYGDLRARERDNTDLKKLFKSYGLKESVVNEASGEYIVYIERDNGRKKLLHTKKSQRAANMFMTKNRDKILNNPGIRSIGNMSKDEWEKNHAHLAESIKKSDMKTITKKEWDRKHKDFKGIVKGQPYMMYYDKDTQSTVYGPVNIKESVNEASRRAADFYGDSKHGKALHSLLKGKWDSKKVEKYFDKIQPDNDIKYMRAIDFISKDAGLDTRKYKTIGQQLPDLMKKLEVLYKDFLNESVVNEVTRLTMSKPQMKKLHNAYGKLTYDQMKRMMLSVVTRDKFIKSLKKFDKKSLQQLVDMQPNSPFSKTVQSYIDGKIKESVVNEMTTGEAKRVAIWNGLDADQLQRFFDENELSLEKAMKYYKKGKLKDSIELLSAMKGDSSAQKKLVNLFKESVVNESKKSLEKKLKKGSVLKVYPYSKRHGNLVVDKIFKNKDGETSFIGKHEKSGETHEYILNDKDILVKESVVNEGKKAFKVNPQIGKAKYSISFHDGKSKNKDGSDFWGIEIFKNKVDLEKAIKNYKSKGFVAESVVNERKYANQTGVKSALLRDNEFSNLLSPKEQKWVRGNDVRIYKGIGMNASFTDGKSEMIVNVNKPMSVVKKLGRASNEIKKVYQQNESVVNEAIGMDKSFKKTEDIMAISRMTGVPWYEIEAFVRKHKLKDLKKVKKLVKGMGIKKDERFAQVVDGKFSAVRNFVDMYKDIKESAVSEKKVPKKGSPDYHQHKIAVDTVKNPRKSFMGGPSATEAEETLIDKFGYSKNEIERLKR